MLFSLSLVIRQAIIFQCLLGEAKAIVIEMFNFKYLKLSQN